MIFVTISSTIRIEYKANLYPIFLPCLPELSFITVVFLVSDLLEKQTLELVLLNNDIRQDILSHKQFSSLIFTAHWKSV
jgi:hypothetical protein